MCLFRSTRCMPEITHARNIPWELLQCTSVQGAVPPADWVMPIYVFYQTLARRELIRNICQDLLDRSAEYSKTLYFCQIALFMVLVVVVWTRDIWPLIRWYGAVY